MGKEKSKQKQKMQSRENGIKIYNNNVYKNISNIKKENGNKKEKNDNIFMKIILLKKKKNKYLL